MPATFDPVTQVVSKDVIIDAATGITARLFLPTDARAKKLPILVYFHGGGFLVESAFSPTFHPHLNNLASLGPVLGVSVNYRLAPEHPLPIAYEDSWAALQWVFSRKDPWLATRGDFDRLYIAGDSAGGNICQQMAVRAGAEGVTMIHGMALINSYFWGEKPVGTENRDANFRADMKRIWLYLCPGTIGLDDPRINPLAKTAPSLAALGCKRVLVTVAELDLLWNRGMHYYEKIKSSGWGGEAKLINVPGEEHDFHIFHPETKASMAFTKRLAAFFV